MTYQIEMLWQCCICAHRGNRGLKDRFCCNCGHKKDASDTDYMPDDTSEAAALSGDEKRRAEAGADWVCKYCDALQNQLNKCCGNCGAKDRGTTPRQPTILPPPRAPRAAAAPKTFAPAAVDVDPNIDSPPAWTRARAHYALRWLAAALALSALVYSGWWLFAPHIVTAKVVSCDWTQATVIERYRVYEREGFTPPGDSFETAPVGMRHHHYDHVHVGSHREPYSESYTCGESCSTSPSYTVCTPNNNGTASCERRGGERSCSPKYCERTAYRTVQDYEDVSRQQMWFRWKVWDWGYNRTVSRSGHNSEPVWAHDEDLQPGAPLATGERERSHRDAAYKVTFRDADRESYEFGPSGIDQFLSYHPGDERKLKVTHAGSVEVLP